MNKPGVFETILCVKDEFRNLDAHYHRVSKKVEKLSFEDFVDILNEQKIDLEKYAMRVAFYFNGQLEVTTRPHQYTRNQYISGYKLCTSEIIVDSRNQKLYYKTTENSHRITELERIKLLGFDEALILNEKGLITECIFSNLFFIKSGELYTAHVECGLLEGTMRGEVLKRSKELGIKTNLGYYSIEDIFAADEVFITNALMGIMPVNSIDHIEYCCRDIIEVLKGELL